MAIPAAERTGTRTFLVVWFGQLVSLVGSNLTWFGLSIYIFQQTGSVTQLALVMLAGLVPRLILTPFAGALVDRWDRRAAMMLSDLGAGLGTLMLVALYFNGSLALWNILLASAVIESFQAIQWPAYQAAMQVLVPRDQFSRAAGLVQLAEAVGQIGGPILAGVLIVTVGIGGIFLVDVATFLFAVGTLLIVRFPRPAASEAGAAGAGTLWEETKYGFSYLWHRHGLFALMIYFAMINLAFGFISPLFIPLGLSVTGAAELGTAFAVASTGMLVGGLVASAWKGFDHKIAGVVAMGIGLGAAMILTGGKASIAWITASVWFGMSLVPIATASSQALWLSKVEPDVQGRVAAVRATVAMSMMPIAYVLVGPLADHVFEPLMAEGGGLADSLGSLVGTGPGRGYGVFFSVLGIFVVGMSILAWLYPPLRNVERDIPDVEIELEGQGEPELVVDLGIDVTELPAV
jgi:MFS family permease